MSANAYCGCCGGYRKKGSLSGHRCPERALRSIDAANTKAANDDENGTAHAFLIFRPWTERLAKGFDLMSDEEII